MTRTQFIAAIALAGASTLSLADINVGVTVSATGPAASLGIPEKNTIALMPQTIGGQKVNYIVLDDASDTTTKKARPGTPEFRLAMRDALEAVHDVRGANGIFSMSKVDHLGLDQRAVVMVRIENGAWKYEP